MICVHDSEHNFTQTDLDDGTRVTVVNCKDCGNILYERRIYADLTTFTCVVDDVYELLYTKKGKQTLLWEAVTARGMPIPAHWAMAL